MDPELRHREQSERFLPTPTPFLTCSPKSGVGRGVSESAGSHLLLAVADKTQTLTAHVDLWKSLKLVEGSPSSMFESEVIDKVEFQATETEMKGGNIILLTL